MGSKCDRVYHPIGQPCTTSLIRFTFSPFNTMNERIFVTLGWYQVNTPSVSWISSMALAIVIRIGSWHNQIRSIKYWIQDLSFLCRQCGHIWRLPSLHWCWLERGSQSWHITVQRLNRINYIRLCTEMQTMPTHVHTHTHRHTVMVVSNSRNIKTNQMISYIIR